MNMFTSLAVFAFAAPALAQSLVDHSLQFNAPPGSHGFQPTGSSYLATWTDNFNRPDAPTLGVDWTTIGVPDAAIVSNHGRSTGATAGQWTQHTSASVAYGQAKASVDVMPVAGQHFVAHIFGAGGTNTVFLKVQSNTATGMLDHVGFYQGINGGGWTGGAGFVALSNPTAQARISCYFSNNGDTAHIDLDHNFDGVPEEQLISNGLLGSGLLIDGTGFGLGFWLQADFDNWTGGDGQTAPPPVTYCTAKTTSIGCQPSIGFNGAASASAGSGFVVNGTNFINNKNCLLFYGVSGQSALPFQGGTLCVKSQIKRTPSTNTGGNPPPNDCSGAPGLDMNLFAVGGLGGIPLPALLVAGTVVDCQWWGRDPGLPPPNNTQLSNGLEYTIGL